MGVYVYEVETSVAGKEDGAVCIVCEPSFNLLTRLRVEARGRIGWQDMLLEGYKDINNIPLISSHPLPLIILTTLTQGRLSLLSKQPSYPSTPAQLHAPPQSTILSFRHAHLPS